MTDRAEQTELSSGLASSAPVDDAARSRDTVSISGGLMVLRAAACGFGAANIYYSQPLVGPISESLGIFPNAAGLIVTMTQIGYGVGLVFIVPLGDLIENRRLVLCIMAGGAIALLAAGCATVPVQFLAAALLIGVGSVSVQILVPFASHLAAEASRGRVIGNITGGLMLGIMLSRPAASAVTAISSWRVVFLLAALAMLLVATALALALPTRKPESRLGYGELIASMMRLVLTMPVLRRRALYHAFLFASGDRRGDRARGAGQRERRYSRLQHPEIRLADHGWSKSATGLAMAMVAAAFLLTHAGRSGSTLALASLVSAAIILDFGVQANAVLGQRAIFMLGADVRNRLNGLYIASFFVAGAVGSALGGWAFAQGGWTLTSWSGFALAAAALLSFSFEPN